MVRGVLVVLIVVVIAVAVYFAQVQPQVLAPPQCRAEESFKVCQGMTYCRCSGPSGQGDYLWGYPSSGNCGDNAPQGCTNAPTTITVVPDETEIALCALAKSGVAPKNPECPKVTYNGRSCITRNPEDYVRAFPNDGSTCCTAFKVADCIWRSGPLITPGEPGNGEPTAAQPYPY